MRLTPVILISLAFVSAGCAHKVTFDKPPPYSISTTQQNAGVIAVIDQATLSNKVPIRSFMTGIAHSWEAQPGDMLKQVAEMELPQMFSDYEFSTIYRERTGEPKFIVLGLDVPSYEFEDFRAKVKVTATVYGPGKTQLLRETYAAEGFSQGGKMFWGGAFAMKSAIRQSSFDAYKQVFEQMRPDVLKALERSATAPLPME
jgi:hypothetical protein